MSDSANKHKYVYYYGAHYVKNGAVIALQNSCTHTINVGLFTFRAMAQGLGKRLSCFLDESQSHWVLSDSDLASGGNNQ